MKIEFVLVDYVYFMAILNGLEMYRIADLSNGKYFQANSII